MPSVMPDVKLMNLGQRVGYWITSTNRSDSARGLLCFCGADSRIISSDLLRKLRKAAPLSFSCPFQTETVTR